MLKVPRICPQWIVKLANSTSVRGVSAAVYIGSDVVTLGYIAKHSAATDMQQAKKRPGSRSSTPSLTQSLTLSHIHKILDRLKSSATIAIILPDSLFTRITLSLPVNLAPQDIGPTLSWALQQQGFAPASDWLWDTRITEQKDPNEAAYEVLLIEAATVDQFLERLGVSVKRIHALVSDAEVNANECIALNGPWLNHMQARQILTLLDTVLASKHPQRVINPDEHPAGMVPGPASPLNLACNLIARISRRYRIAFCQVTVAAGAILCIGGGWWWQYISASQKTTATDTVQLTAPSVPLHPIFSHAHLWQQLQTLNSDKVAVKRLEFRGGRWLLQIQAQSPGLADVWVKQFGEHLNSTPAAVGGVPAPAPWRILTSASRTEQSSTQIDLELHQ